MSKSVPGYLFLACVVTSPVLWLLMVQPWGLNHAWPWLSADLLASYVWLGGASVTMFLGIGRGKKVALAVFSLLGCGPLLFSLYFFVLVKVLGFAP